MKNLIKNISLLSFIALLLIASSCKKDKDTSTGICVLNKVGNTGSDTALVVYDALGRVISYGSASNYVVDISYTGGLTASSTITSPDTSRAYMNIFLNSAGRVQSMNQTVRIAGTDYTYTFNFQYDAEGHIILSESTLDSPGPNNTTFYKDSLVYAGGNLMAKYIFTRNNNDPYVLSDYIEIDYTNELNKAGYHIWSFTEEPISMISGWQAFYHLFGNTSKNLPSTTRGYTSAGNLHFQINYSFLLNAEGYPTDENISRTMLVPYTRNRTFEYSCN